MGEEPLFGIVTKIESDNNEIDTLWVDCGIILPIKIKKGKLNVDETIQAEGRLDAYKIE